MHIISIKKLVGSVSLLLLSFAYNYSHTIHWGLSARQGDRPTMEDTHMHITNVGNNNTGSFFAVYDGHSGKDAARIAHDTLHTHIDYANANSAQQLHNAFLKTEADICAHTSSGSCAVTAYITDTHAHIAWVGDSRAVVIRDGCVVFATTDHKPHAPAEQERIERVGGHVIWWGGFRVEGLAVSRSLGDKNQKISLPGGIIAAPEIHAHAVQSGDIIIVACDGIWDVMSNQHAADIVCKAFNTPLDALQEQFPPIVMCRRGGEDVTEEDACGGDLLKLVARALRDSAYQAGSRDNLSVEVIQIQ